MDYYSQNKRDDSEKKREGGPEVDDLRCTSDIGQNTHKSNSIKGDTTYSHHDTQYIMEAMEKKRKQLDMEIAKYKAEKEEEYRSFERDLRSRGRKPGKENDDGGGYKEVNSAALEQMPKLKAPEPPTRPDTESGKGTQPVLIEQPDHLGDQQEEEENEASETGASGHRTPPHERELEFRGLFTPSFLPLLDSGDHGSTTGTISAPLLSPEITNVHRASTVTRDSLKRTASEPVSATSPSIVSLLTVSLPTRSPSSSPHRQGPPTSFLRNHSATASLPSSIRGHSQRPRSPKHVLFKLDDLVVRPAASFEQIKLEPSAEQHSTEQGSASESSEEMAYNEEDLPNLGDEDFGGTQQFEIVSEGASSSIASDSSSGSNSHGSSGRSSGVDLDMEAVQLYDTSSAETTPKATGDGGTTWTSFQDHLNKQKATEEGDLPDDENENEEEIFDMDETTPEPFAASSHSYSSPNRQATSKPFGLGLGFKNTVPFALPSHNNTRELAGSDPVVSAGFPYQKENRGGMSSTWRHEPSGNHNINPLNKNRVGSINYDSLLTSPTGRDKSFLSESFGRRSAEKYDYPKVGGGSQLTTDPGTAMTSKTPLEEQFSFNHEDEKPIMASPSPHASSLPRRIQSPPYHTSASYFDAANDSFPKDRHVLDSLRHEADVKQLEHTSQSPGNNEILHGRPRFSFSSGSSNPNSMANTKGNPFSGRQVSRVGEKLASEAPNIGSYVGGLRGNSGYDPSDQRELENVNGRLAGFREKHHLDEVEEARKIRDAEKNG
ncbi:MAG: hypothetical protein M1827_002579 [Pycnora praestabilis]|nr:MAG: hypothetical protein M1827_002579 [Pycnora praestabilis]